MTDLDFLQNPTSSPSPAPTRRPRITLGTVVLLAGIAAIAVVFAVQLARQTRGPIESGRAPHFVVTTFDGQTIDLDALRGQVVLVNFWAEWCVPCREEAPHLQAVWEKYRERDVVMIGIAWSDIDSNSLRFIEEFGLTYPNAPDLGTRIGDDYAITGVPETYIIDQQGQVVERLIGTTRVNETYLSSVIDRLLAAS
jgi:cytochrome c biogenesis protein CcmG, thiol:disulfide interchange protein DsbE